ncbi:hypothetical protein R4E92_06730 [Morganella morganii]|uniref:hypothetical protein n=1 Tax=Morganella morganii TaxID=582 RepID=UPI00298ECD8C|nr:hypothetical protein [Morganella morganii]MDW7790091.1 hypothetical protein [Morganella morganii]
MNEKEIGEIPDFSALNEIDQKIKETELRLKEKQDEFRKNKKLGARLTEHRFKI